MEEVLKRIEEAKADELEKMSKERSNTDGSKREAKLEELKRENEEAKKRFMNLPKVHSNEQGDSKPTSRGNGTKKDN